MQQTAAQLDEAILIITARDEYMADRLKVAPSAHNQSVLTLNREHLATLKEKRASHE